MPNEVASSEFLSKIYAQIVRGYSTTPYQSASVFIRHFGIEEQFLIQRRYDDVLAKAKKEGLPTEEEALLTLEEQGAWTKTEESDLEKQRNYIEGLRNSRKHLIIPSQVEQLSQQLEEAEKALYKKEHTKKSLLTDTCEHFADSRSNDYSVYLSFCKDAEFTPLFTKTEFDELEKPELYKLVGLYNDAMEPLGTDNIKRIAIAPFFVNYFNLTGDNPSSFFEGPISQLTYYQVNLLNYGRVFKSIFENVADIPDHVADDPDKILDYAESTKKSEASREKAESSDGYSVVGANDGDLETMGLKNSQTKSIFDLAAEKGGNLSMSDFK
jgi:hypothetical protein